MQVRQSRVLFILFLCLAAITLSGNAHAQIDPRVTEAVGDIATDVQCPQSGYIADGNAAKQVALQRSVRITYSKPGLGYQDAFARQTLLYAGQVAVLNQCPVTTAIYGVQGGAANVQDIGAEEIYGSPTDGAPVRLLLRAAPFNASTMLFGNFVDLYAAEQQQEAQQQVAQQQVAAAAQEQVAEQQQAVQQAATQAATQVAAQQSSAEWDAWWGGVWGIIKMLLVLGALVWLATKWETFARWYYLLTPHPATDMVHTAIAGGAIDGKLFAELMRPMPGNQIERQVRARQARELEELARQCEAQLRQRADEVKRKVEEEAAFRAAQRGLHDAAVDAQLAKARADLLEKLAESLRQSTEAT